MGERPYFPIQGKAGKTRILRERFKKNRIAELEMRVERLQRFLSECGRM